ncbi:MAG: hypothetical protein H6625_01000 [Bdellovibrionaceae bacterium]|nr:hypothetical protein [Pseudobdellovibrionaceae bacterium]
MKAVWNKFLLLFFALNLLSSNSYAEELTPLALFYRCYAHITQKRPPLKSDLLIQVVSGKMKPIEACLTVLHKAKLNNDGALRENNDPVAKDVLKSFHNLHSSWFQNKDFPGIFAQIVNFSIEYVNDNTSPALYFTKSLFSDSTQLNYILKSNKNLMPIRTDNNPTKFANKTKDDFIFDNSVFTFAPFGELLGAKEINEQIWSYSYKTPSKNVYSGSLPTHIHNGGGILGSDSYILQNVDEASNFVSDGAVKMPRKWVRSFISDLMCRTLPMIRPNDADHLIVPTSNVEFRKTRDCNRCHATMDRMASTLRNIKFLEFGAALNTPQYGGVFPQYLPTTQPAESGWPAESDSNYAKRPTNGTLFYRNYKGELIDQKLTSVTDLGDKLAEQDDVYVCLASRYYEYFTGIKTNVADIGDSSLEYKLTDADLKHRNLVIKLGQELKEHQNSMTLIENILKLPIYSQSDLGLVNNRETASE